jgi:hypothetical protein
MYWQAYLHKTSLVALKARAGKGGFTLQRTFTVFLAT